MYFQPWDDYTGEVFRDGKWQNPDPEAEENEDDLPPEEEE